MLVTEVEVALNVLFLDVPKAVLLDVLLLDGGTYEVIGVDASVADVVKTQGGADDVDSISEASVEDITGVMVPKVLHHQSACCSAPPSGTAPCSSRPRPWPPRLLLSPHGSRPRPWPLFVALVWFVLDLGLLLAEMR